MSQKTVFYLCCLVACFHFSHAYRNCGEANSLANLLDVKISNCDISKTCILKHGTNVTIELDFQAKYDIHEVTTVVHGQLPHLPPIPFPIDNPDSCMNAGLMCPLKANMNYTYRKAILVNKAYPKVSVDVIWKLQQGDDVIVCIQIPAKISG